ncbi:MAG: hypothetical protein M1821_004833 [Bathelium mastoideum]|nr:MAG: hypothetical protein M1821_004833 [Bathelium mastoideum]
MSGGEVLKADKDFTEQVNEQLPQAQKLAEACVQASDLPSTSRIIVAIITLCKEAGDWTLLKDQILSLSKKHGQLKQAITRMVQVAMGFLDDTPDIETKLLVIEILRTVTEGKIFVEVERARVTRILSNIKKSQGDINAATDILCELQVETFGSMSRREKTEFILEQVSLCIENGDWVQAGILSRKISTRYFARKPKKTAEELEKERKEREEKEKKRSVDEPPPEPEDDVTDLKLKYYEQQIILAKHEDKYLDVCKHYRQVLDTEAVENDPDKLKASLQRIIYFIILAPHDNEQSDLLHRIAKDSRPAQLIPTDAALLKLFTVPELMRWPMVAQQYGPHLCNTDVFAASAADAARAASTATPSTSSASGAGAIAADDAKAYTRWQALRTRVIEHNVRVVAKYYTRIALPRLTTLLDLDAAETESVLAELVTNGTVYARIDRPAQVVSFARVRGADDVLNEWSADMKGLLGLLERIDHLITKEEMMARIQTKKGGSGGGEGKAGKAGKVH